MNQNSSSPIQRRLKQLRMTFWQRRVILGLFRTMWLILLVPIGFMIAYIWFDRPVSILIGLLIAMWLALLSILWNSRPLTLHRMVHRLEARLGFQSELLTAYETSQTEPDDTSNPIVAQLFQEAIDLIGLLRRRVRYLSMNLWLEVSALIALTAVLSGLLMVDALTPLLPNADVVDLPPLWVEPKADEVLPPDVTLFPPPFQEPPALTPQQIEHILEILADAFRDQAITRAVADALDRGDVVGAAEELRRLADQLDAISDAAQQELGDALDNAANEIGDDAPTVTDPLRQGSSALGSGAINAASQAMEELAEALDAIADMQNGESEELAEESNADGDAGGGMEGEPDQPEAGQGQGGDQGGGNSEEEQAAPQEEGEQEPIKPLESPSDAGEDGGDGEEAELDGGGDEANEGEGEGDEGPAQPTEEERLGIEGEPLELTTGEENEFESENRVLQPSELDAEAGERTTESSPFARPLGSNEALGADPLTYPWEKRDLIRRYFTE
ncbi:hypothetical protein QUF63_00040 [Anaerolineales bacterium HSG25]|nr:hypothetical protein [Anaerolineales bacterium HSG25]